MLALGLFAGEAFALRSAAEELRRAGSAGCDEAGAPTAAPTPAERARPPTACVPRRGRPDVPVLSRDVGFPAAPGVSDAADERRRDNPTNPDSDSVEYVTSDSGAAQAERWPRQRNRKMRWLTAGGRTLARLPS